MKIALKAQSMLRKSIVFYIFLELYRNLRVDAETQVPFKYKNTCFRNEKKVIKKY